MEIGYNSGVCHVCGRTYTNKKPLDYVICDCWQYCPNGHFMVPYFHEASPNTYNRDIELQGSGDTDKPMQVIRWCPICHYYSSQQPVEVYLK